MKTDSTRSRTMTGAPVPPRRQQWRRSAALAALSVATASIAIAVPGVARACTALPSPAPVSPPSPLPHSAATAVRSAAGEGYRITLAWPEGDPPAAGWPVLYVLDGERRFTDVVLAARRLAGQGGAAPGVVVGIDAGPLPRRVRDYTPATANWTIPAGRPASGLATGGAEPFLDLLADRVQPLVRAHCRVDPARETLLGHSFGGLLALHAALTRPALVDRVVAVSPSIWFGDGLLLREAAAARHGMAALIAEGEGSEAAQALAARIAGTRFLPLPGQRHGTTMPAAIVPAIEFAFGKAAR